MIDLNLLKRHADLLQELLSSHAPEAEIHEAYRVANREGVDSIALAQVVKERLLCPEERARVITDVEVYRVALGVTSHDEAIERTLQSASGDIQRRLGNGQERP